MKISGLAHKTFEEKSSLFLLFNERKMMAQDVQINQFLFSKPYTDYCILELIKHLFPAQML